jgi:nitroreductase
MDALRAILSKRDTRSFRSEPVADDVIERVLMAARMAGSAKNRQLVRMVLVTDDEVRTALAPCGDFTAWIPSAPAIVVFVVPKEGGRLFDIGRMAQNLMIAANALGLASCPVTFQHQDRMASVLGLPDTHEGPMGVALGHPGEEPDKNPLRSPRIPLEELVMRERWAA